MLPAVAVAANEPRTDLRSLSALSDVGRALASGAELRASLSGRWRSWSSNRGIAAAPCSARQRRLRTSAWRPAVGIPRGPEGALQGGRGRRRARVQSGRPVVIPATAREPMVMNGHSSAARAAPIEPGLRSHPARPASRPRHRRGLPLQRHRRLPERCPFLSGGGVRCGPAPAARSAPSRPSAPACWPRTSTSGRAGAALRLLEHRRDQRFRCAGSTQILRCADQHHRDDPGESGTGQGS